MDGSMEFTMGLSQGIAWPWPIAVYLFLAGISGGALVVALAIRFIKDQTANTPLYKSAALISFVTISLGMLCLVLDLTNPLFFWRILVFYNFTSVMSLGVIALCAYIPLTAVLCLYAFEDDIKAIKGLRVLLPFISMLQPIRRPLEVLTLILAMSVCAYTGFLISALIRFPLINTAVLPALFIVSGVSAGAAASKMVSVLVFKEDLHSSELKLLHGAEWPIMITEILFIVMIAMSLVTGNEGAQSAFSAFITGVWANLFWVGVVGVGFLGPIVLNFATGKTFSHSAKAFYLSGICVISGMMCLRLFILYAGQTYGI